MKKLILTMLIGTAMAPAEAQLFLRDPLGAAVLGGLVGGIVGHNSGRHTAEGVGIGVGAGLLLGALASNGRESSYVEVQPATPFVPAYAPQRLNYPMTGAVLGGIAGGIIGHNSGRHTAEGIAIGATSGLILGAVAEQSAQRKGQVQPAPMSAYVVQSTPSTAVQAINSAQPQPAVTTTINAYSTGPSSAMAGANSLFGR